MTVQLNASLSAGLTITPDTSGSLALQTAGTTAVTIGLIQEIQKQADKKPSEIAE